MWRTIVVVLCTALTLLPADVQDLPARAQKADATSISVPKKKSRRWRAVLIGAAVGFGAAFPIGVASAGYLSDQNNPRFGTRAGFGAGFGLFGAGIGAGIGALAGGKK